MKNKKKSMIFAGLLCLTVAVSAMGMGMASWRTEINGTGNVTAAGTWDVKITDAELNLSNVGASATATTTKTTYEMQRTGAKDDILIAATIGASTSVDDETLVGTQSNEAMSRYTNYYAIDAAKYDVTSLASITVEERNKMVEDETTVVISDHLKMYYRNTTTGAYKDIDYNNPSYDYNKQVEYSNATAEAVVDGLIRDTEALLQEMYPDTWQNYVLCSLSSSLMKSNHTIASVVEDKVTETVPAGESNMVTYTDTTVTYADVNFCLPGAWADYSLTVTNNGTVDANLNDIAINLETESEQLQLTKPDLSKEVLEPGESCTINFVVQVPEEVTDNLNATGKLTVTLGYDQTAVEDAPTAGHSHSTGTN